MPASKALESSQVAHTLLSFWQENRSFFDQHYGSMPDIQDASSQPRSEIIKPRTSRADRDEHYSLTLPERAIKTDKYIVVHRACINEENMALIAPVLCNPLSMMNESFTSAVVTRD